MNSTRTGKLTQVHYTLYVFLLAFLASTLFTVSIDVPEADLDSGYSWAFNALTWGKFSNGEVQVFTFGPLGFLIGRRFDYGYQTMIAVVFWWTICLLMAAIITIICEKKFFSKKQILRGVLFALAISYSILNLGEYVLLGLCFLIVTARGIGVRDRFRALEIGAWAVVGICFAIKITLGVGVALLTVFGLGILVKLRWSQRLLTLIIGIVVSTCTFLASWKLSGQSFENLVFYFSTFRPVSVGYATAMTNYEFLKTWPLKFFFLKTVEDRYLQWLAVAILYGVATISTIVGLLILAKRRAFILSVVPSLLLLYKHSITRLGPYHVYHLPAFLTCLMVVCLFLEEDILRFSKSKLALFLAMLYALVIPQFALSVNLAERISVPALNFVEGRLFSNLNNLIHLRELRLSAFQRAEIEAARNQLPTVVRAALGRKTVDIFPHQLYLVPMNDLRWVPRPVPVSFQSYTQALDKLNEQHFRSAAAPQLILVARTPPFADIHPDWAEPLTSKVLNENYEIEVETSEWTVFAKKRSVEESNLSKLGKEFLVRTDEWVNIPQKADSRIYVSIVRNETALRQLMRLVTREEPVYMTIQGELNAEIDYRFLPSQEPTPMLVSPISDLERGAGVRRVNNSLSTSRKFKIHFKSDRIASTQFKLQFFDARK